MKNCYVLEAKIAQCGVIRYTPAGLAVLNMMLEHHSTQPLPGSGYEVYLRQPAKLFGNQALEWVHKQGSKVRVQGFLSRSRRYIDRTPILNIQDIYEI